MFKIIRVLRSTTKSGSPMWRCTTDDNNTVFVFQSDKPDRDTLHYFADSGYLSEFLALVKDQEHTWKLHPIEVELAKEGDFWRITHVWQRPDGAAPDPDEKPNIELLRIYARQHAHLLFMHAPIYLDTETTGTDAEAEIVQIGILDHAGRVLLNSYVTPQHPERLVVGDPSPASITGITPGFLAAEKAPTFPDLYPTLRTLLMGKIWCIYNAKFDTQILQQVCLRHGLAPIPSVGVNCAMEIASTWRGEWDYKYKRFAAMPLSDLCEACGIVANDAHDALADIIMTRDLIHYIGEGRPVPTLEPTTTA